MACRFALMSSVLVACSASPSPSAAAADDTLVPTERGIDGCNCAGAAPFMLGYPFPSVVAYYYQVLQAFWTEVDEEQVLTTWMPPELESVSEAFVSWQAKTVQILRDVGELGFTHRFYAGIFGFLPAPARGAICSPALDENIRKRALLAHVGLSQAGVCGKNTDGTTKFWQVNNISLLEIGEVYDAYELVGAGLARLVTEAPASRCILPASYTMPIPIVISDYDPVISCWIAFRDDAVTEGVVLPIPSSAVVANVPVRYRGFTAAGTVPLPNGLDAVRTILRDDELRVMFAIGVPMFMPEPMFGPTIERNQILLFDEQTWVDATVQTYEQACCRTLCPTTTTSSGTRLATVDSDGSGSTSGTGSDSGGGSGSGTACETTCIPEGICQTATAGDGLVVMESLVTTAECNGDCPEPAPFAPPSTPVCAP